MSISRRRSEQVLLALFAMSHAGCNEPATLFDESGAWSLVQHDLEPTGQLLDVDVFVRKDSFLLRYWPADGVVQTAACAEQPDDSPASSLCETSNASAWHCRCFAYAFEDDVQQWVEFEAGENPPSVAIDGAGTTMTLEPVEGITDTYTFSPLPAGVFGSNGESSRYVFRRKAAASFTRVFEDAERGTCEPCVGEP